MKVNHRSFGLDMVRGLAALAVMVSHVAVWWVGFLPGLVPPVHLLGHLGVEAFFVLSGFMIGGVLLRDQPTSAPAILRFWARRILRTMPLFAVAGLVHLAVLERSPLDASLWRYLTHTAFIPVLGSHREVWFSVAWSLSVEEWAYFLVPLVLVAGKRLNAGFGRSLALVLVALLTLRWCLVFMGLPPADLATGTPFRMDPILWGLLAARFWAKPQSPSWRCTASILAIALVGGFALLWVLRFNEFQASPLFHSLGWTLLDIGLAAGICALKEISSPNRTWARPTSFLAAMSYPVYLFHMVPIRMLGSAASSPTAAIGLTALAVASTFLGAWLAHRWVEAPCLAFGEQFREPR